MSFAAPWVLLALLLLPGLWWLLRASPPAVREQLFPALGLLSGLKLEEQTPARTPPWLLALRLAAAAAVIVGLAGPVRPAARLGLAGRGPLLLVIDTGWAAAADWPARLQAAGALLDEAAQQGRPVRLLTTAADGDGAPPRLGPTQSVAALRPVLAALRPASWPVDRQAALRALDAAPAGGPVAYLDDGVDTPGRDAFARRLAAIGPVEELRAVNPGALLLGVSVAGDALVARLRGLPARTARRFDVLGRADDDTVLARRPISLPAGAASGEVAFSLPAELRNRLGRFTLAAASQAGTGEIGTGEIGTGEIGAGEIGAIASAGAVALLDEGDRRRPVGLVSAGDADEAPLTGSLYYLQRALAPLAELRQGSLATLLARPLAMLVLTGPVPRAEGDALQAWVRRGGLLLRFAYPGLSDAAASSGALDAGALDAGALDAGALDAGAANPGATDPGAANPGATDASTANTALLPVRLLSGDRQLGGTMSWSAPQHLAGFPAHAPFAGLAVPGDVTVSRQVLAAPSPELDARSWARLADGTPLVTSAALGAGHVVLVHVTAGADWSNLPLSGLFPRLLERLLRLSVGVGDAGGSSAGAAGRVGSGARTLVPVLALDGGGVLGPPGPAASVVEAGLLAGTAISPQHPPGLYAPPGSSGVVQRQALNLASATPLAAAPAVPGAAVRGLQLGAARPFGPWLVGAALALLSLDMLASLALRGVLVGVRAAALGLVLLALVAPAHAQPTSAQATPGQPTSAQATPGQPTSAQATPGQPTSGQLTPGQPSPALATHLAYVETGDEAVDRVVQEGLDGLSQVVNARTSAQLAEPMAVRPGRDELAYYPMLYWAVTASTAPDPAMVAALNDYMAHGGLLVIDTRGGDEAMGGADAGFGDVGGEALRRLGDALHVPPLTPLSIDHVLARSFYLLREYPGRVVGDPVWVARDAAAGRDDDSVSPLVVGANDWAGAWAVDSAGQPLFEVVPGGSEQRERE